MGFFKELGTFVGKAAGIVLGGTVSAVGEATGIQFVKEVGDGVNAATTYTGVFLGNTIEGGVMAIEGLITVDKERMKEGAGQVGNAALQLGKGVGKSAVNIAQNGGKVISGIANGEYEKAKDGLRELAKVAAVSAIAIGVTDVLVDIGPDVSVDDIDAVEFSEDLSIDDASASVVAASGDMPETPGVHEVEPHNVSGYTTSDGTFVEGYWRDGDGNTNIDLSKEQGGGYIRSNPDGDPTNNLRS